MKYLAVSGGMDSMFMLDLFHKDKDVKVIHYVYDDDFGIRAKDLVLKVCNHLQVECLISQTHEKNKYHSNDEADWREGRYQFFDSVLTSGDYLYVAHHLDDQLNSYLAAKLKTSYLAIDKSYKEHGTNTKRVFMPIISQRQGYSLVRPLYSISKDFIRKQVKHLNIPYVEDPMNKVGQRSITDNEIIPLLKATYPQFYAVFMKDYKDYVNRTIHNSDVLSLLFTV